MKPSFYIHKWCVKNIIVNCCYFQQSEVEPYLDKNIWNTLASNIPVDSMGYSKDMLPDSRDIINFVEGSQSILIDTREGIHGELVGQGKEDHGHHSRHPGDRYITLLIPEHVLANNCYVNCIVNCNAAQALELMSWS